MNADATDGTRPHAPYAPHASHAVLGEPLQMLALTALITWVTLGLTGFAYGSNINLFNIPYVERFLDRQEFAADPFVMSLDDFASVVWPPMRWMASLVHAESLFAMAHIVTRFASIYTLLLLARRVEHGIWSASASVVLVAVAMCLMVHSPVGTHQMFIAAFTHSALTWPLIFLLFSFLLGEQYRAAAIMLGLMPGINAFVALWMQVVAMAMRGREFCFATRRIQGQTVALYLLLACPVIVWIIGSVAGTGVVTHFSYRAYIREYFPDHFLIEAATVRNLIRETVMLAAAWVAAGHIGHTAFWRRGLVCLTAIMLAGSILPYLLDSRIVFNLHLLRVDGVLFALGLILQSLAFVRMIRVSANWPYRAFLVVMAICTFALPLSISLGLAAMLTLAFHGSSIQQRLLDQVRSFGQRLPVIAKTAPDAASLLACGLVVLASQRAVAVLPAPKPPLSASWDQVAAAIRKEGGPGPYLVPLGDEADIFLLQAERRPWVSWKEGAAVMWAPAFYAQWHTRHSEVKALETPEALLDYAQAHAIRQLVLKAPAECRKPYEQTLNTADYIWCTAPP